MAAVDTSNLSRQLAGDGFDLAEHPQQVLTPQLGNLLFRVSSPNQLEGHVERLAGVIPTRDPSTAIEV